jgi:hypothetical protein
MLCQYGHQSTIHVVEAPLINSKVVERRRSVSNVDPTTIFAGSHLQTPKDRKSLTRRARALRDLPRSVVAQDQFRGTRGTPNDRHQFLDGVELHPPYT